MRAQIRRVVGRRVGPALGWARTLENFGRPAWLYRLGGAAPTGEQRFRPARAVSDADLELCQRLVAAHRLAQAEAPPPSGMWSHSVFDERQRRLREALGRGDPRAVAELLAAMFRSDFVLGLAPGSLGRERRPGPLARLSWLSAMDKLVALAEALGTVRTENPEQGPVGSALRGGLDELVAAMEDRLGLSLDFPPVGAAYGVVAGGRLITPETPDQVYGAARLRDVIEAYLPPADEPPRIVEIGGGYGGMAYWLLQMVDARYVIVDLPIVGVLQGYFLAQALGHDAVALHGEPPARVTIVPNHALASVQAPVDILANKDSLPEIPLDAAVGYLEWARSACRGAFYSNNQEGAAVFDGVAQNVVCELVERVGGFTRVRRDASWLRRGYVEEVYLPVADASAGPAPVNAST
jgi:hypothetical protein